VGALGVVLTVLVYYFPRALDVQSRPDATQQRVQRIVQELLAILDKSPRSPLLEERDEMLEKYDESLRRDPHNVPTLILRGQWQYVRTTMNGGGGLRNALADFRQAAESDPNIADPHFGTGTTLLWLAVFDAVARQRFEIRHKGQLAIDPATGSMKMASPDLLLSLDDRPRTLLQTALEEFQAGLRLRQSYNTLERGTVVLYAPQDIEQRMRTARVLLGHEPQFGTDQWLGRVFTEAYSKINPRAFIEIFEMVK
jgi:hypothetical protein